MTSQKYECECVITPEMKWAGPAIQLCHHSGETEAYRVREEILGILEEFAQEMDPKELFSKTLGELAKNYQQETAGHLAKLLKRDEQMAININFMRSLSLAIQSLMCTMIIQLREEEQGE